MLANASSTASMGGAKAAGMASAIAVRTGADVAGLDGAKVRQALAAVNAGPFTDA